MAGLTKSNQIASLVGSTFRQRNLMMYFLCLHKNSLTITNFTKRMFAYVFVSDTFPSSAVHLLILDIRKASQDFSPTRLGHCTFLLILLYHIVEVDILGQMWTFRAFYIFIGFSGSSTCVSAFPCHLLTVRESAPSSSPICSQV